MPPPLSQEELEEIVDNAVAGRGDERARSWPRHGRCDASGLGRADGSLVSQLVREALA